VEEQKIVKKMLKI